MFRSNSISFISFLFQILHFNFVFIGNIFIKFSLTNVNHVLIDVYLENLPKVLLCEQVIQIKPFNSYIRWQKLFDGVPKKHCDRA